MLASARSFPCKLREFGEFLPYGELIRPNGEFVSVGATAGGEHSPAAELIDILRNADRSEVKAGTILACAVVYDVRIVPPGTTRKSDAIAVEIDHRDGYSVTVFLPYTLGQSREITFASSFAQRGAHAIFGPAA